MLKVFFCFRFSFLCLFLGTFRETRKPQQSKNLQHGCKRLRTLIANARGEQLTTQVDGRDRGVVLVYDESEQLVTGRGR